MVDYNITAGGGLKAKRGIRSALKSLLVYASGSQEELLNTTDPPSSSRNKQCCSRMP